ncbi:hypothetical protein [Tunicatimonas pelagia]|uniref:hypothetical protein n=1 Tax=Tunicatimonas pelagia TaxID=931531 RepID=UPI0026660D62|nr:hypothetical protein [Tunicatimonas pelagia]WKN42354.1 hypothetical protein P0M28_25290 [Tunicatimonas pelagia]
MRPTAFILTAISLLTACSTDDEVPSTSPTSEAATPTYDESLLPEPQPLNNLIANGNFESDEDWFTCGGAQVASTNEGQAMVIATGEVCEEASGSTFTVNAIAAQEINLSAVPELFTVSFLVRIDGTVPNLDFNVFLTNAPDGTYGFGLNEYFLGAPTQEEDQAGG